MNKPTQPKRIRPEVLEQFRKSLKRNRKLYELLAL